MQNNDKAIEYNATLIEIRKRIKDLSNIGIDCKDYSDELKRIENDYNNKLNNASSYGKSGFARLTQEDTYSNIYMSAILKLNKISKELDKYNVYYRAYYAACTIEKTIENRKNSCNGSQISKKELEDMVALTISMINSLNNSDTRVYDSEKIIVEKVYKAAYQVMKLEFRYNFSSKLFEYFKNNEVLKNYLNLYIEEDISNLNTNDKITNYIMEIVNRIKSSGIDYDYLDEILLQYLNFDDNFVEEINSKLKQSQIDTETLNKNLDVKKYNYNDIKRNSLREKKDRNKNRLRAYILSLLVVATAYGSYKGGQAIGRSKTYNTTTESYSSLDDQYEKKEDEYLVKLQNGDKTILTIYEPYKKSGSSYKRKVYEYDLSDIDLGNIKEYAELDLEKLGRKPNTITERKNELSLEDTYENEYYEIARTIQDIEDMVIDDTESKKDSMILLSFGTFLILLILFMIDAFYDTAIIGSIQDAHYHNKKYKESVRREEEILKDIQLIKKELEENEQLRNEIKGKFNMLLNEKNVLRLEK